MTLFDLDIFLNNIILILMVLLSVAFLTLLERKILGYIQIRKGPNKILIKGLFQPISDAFKLLSKEFILIKNLNYIMYLISPILSLLIMLMLWLILPNMYNLYYIDLSMLLVLCYLSMGVYGMMISGWSSNSLYSMLGSIRSIAQTISYEVSMILIMLINLIMIESFNMKMLYEFQIYLSMMFYLYPMMLMLLISLIAELNRTPFDLAEGESELVSGFNTEYMSSGFVLIFLSEYGMIMFMSMMMVMMYVGSYFMVIYFVYMKVLMFMMLIIIFRGSYPRVRYDQLMSLIWKKFLLVILNLLMYIYMFKWVIIYMM